MVGGGRGRGRLPLSSVLRGCPWRSTDPGTEDRRGPHSSLVALQEWALQGAPRMGLCPGDFSHIELAESRLFPDPEFTPGLRARAVLGLVHGPQISDALRRWVGVIVVSHE